MSGEVEPEWENSMAWRMTGRWLGICSCKMVCRCVFGPAEPDEGWCSGGILLDIRQGHSDGVSLAGRRVGWFVDMPKDFSAGNGTCRLYIDEGASADQRRELEAICSGKRGGPFEVVAGIVSEWLPAQSVPIDVRWGEYPSASIGDIGRIQLQPLTDGAGAQTKLVKAPAMAAFGVESYDLARSDGSEWNDPDRRRWRAGGNGDMADFDWSG